jgi:D-alanyl-D-alanine carboxypeptidase
MRPTLASRPRLIVAVASIIAFAPIISQPAPAAGAPPKSWRHDVQRQLDRIVQKGVPGTIALVRDGRASWAFTSGVSDLPRGTPMRLRHRYRIASETKTFVAALVLKLSEEGTLSLDDTVEEWLPGMVPGGNSITVRHLLNHTSGLFNYTEDPAFIDALVAYVSGDEEFFWEPEELVDIATSHPPLFLPGASWSYSNTGYIVAGLIVEAATGRAIEVLLKEKIFDPLRLGDTYLPIRSATLSGPHSHGYLLPGGGQELPNDKPLDVTRFSPSWAWAAGGMVSDAGNVARFYRALLDGRVLTEESMAEMKAVVDVGYGAGYGLGLVQLDTPCGPAWGHNGNFPGFVSNVLSTEDGRRQVVSMRNASDVVKPAVDRADARAQLVGFCGKAALGGGAVARFVRALRHATPAPMWSRRFF